MNFSLTQQPPRNLVETPGFPLFAVTKMDKLSRRDGRRCPSILQSKSREGQESLETLRADRFHSTGPALELLVNPLDGVGRSERLPVPIGELVVDQEVVEILLDTLDAVRTAFLPAVLEEEKSFTGLLVKNRVLLRKSIMKSG